MTSVSSWRAPGRAFTQCLPIQVNRAPLDLTHIELAHLKHVGNGVQFIAHKVTSCREVLNRHFDSVKRAKVSYRPLDPTLPAYQDRCVLSCKAPDFWDFTWPLASQAARRIVAEFAGSTTCTCSDSTSGLIRELPST